MIDGIELEKRIIKRYIYLYSTVDILHQAVKFGDEFKRRRFNLDCFCGMIKRKVMEWEN